MAFALIGQELEHYKLLEALGAGAMSEVYLAHDPRLDKQVAVKVINDNLLGKPELVARFAQESRAAARLEHRNVATVFFSGSHDGKPFYAMELIRGWSLSDVIDSRVAFSWDQVLGLFAQACVGLGAAQLAGVLHRDIKPGNLMVTEDGTLKIVDFGLAKLGEESHLSRSRAMMGTPYYIAPEAVRGGGSDHRSDLYSLGVTLFHVLAGRPPYEAETPYGVMRMHLESPVPTLAALNPDLPPPLAELVQELMAKDPLDRPSTYHDVHLRLRRIASELPPEGRASTISWCGADKVNTGSSEGRCSLCQRPYGAREFPETYHVDLVAWNTNDSRDLVSAYIGKAVGQPAEDVLGLLDPLPFRAAFRVPRERAKRMQRTFYELGADVSLVPADDEEEHRLEIRSLPFSPRWPLEDEEGRGEDDERSGLSETHLRLRGAGQTHPSTLLAAALALAVAVLTVLLVQEKRSSPTEPPAATAQPAPAAPLLDEPVEAEASPPATPAEVDSREAPTPEPTEAVQAEASTAREESSTTEPSEPPATGIRLDSAWFTIDTGSTPPPIASVVLQALDRAGGHIDSQLGLPTQPHLKVRLVPRLLVEDGVSRSWTRSTLSPQLEFPAGGLTPGGHPELQAAARNLVARATLVHRGAGRLPDWLLAGLAALLEAGQVPEPEWPGLLASEGLPTDARITGPSSSPGAERLTQAFSTHLVESRGWSRVEAVVEAVGRGQALDEAALSILGSGVEDLEQEWVTIAGGLD